MPATASGNVARRKAPPFPFPTDPMPIWKNYFIATNIQNALEALSTAGQPSRIIAGGTDLLLDLQQGRHPSVNTLVDVTQIPELTCIDIRSGSLFVGAAVPLSRVAASPLVVKHAQALATASGLVGGPQVRNTATLGGNVGHALPAGDGTISLVALDAKVEIASLDGLRWLPILELFLGPGKSILDPIKEMITGFYLPLANLGEASAFGRVMRSQGIALPIINIAIWLRQKQGVIEDVRIAIGPAGRVPQRGLNAEKSLSGKPLSEESCLQAAKNLREQVIFRTSPHRATADYRNHLADHLLTEVLQEALRAASEELSE